MLNTVGVSFPAGSEFAYRESGYTISFIRGEGSERRSRDFRSEVIERIWEWLDSAFYLVEDTYGIVPISKAFVAKSEPLSVECSVERCRGFDEEHGNVDVMFLPRFRNERWGHRVISRR